MAMTTTEVFGNAILRLPSCFAKFMRRIGSAYARHPPHEFNVELLGGDKIALDGCEATMGEMHERHSRIIEISKIDAVGYVAHEADAWRYDFFLCINSEEVTYMMPIEWPHVSAVVGFLEKTLPNYNSHIGIANSTHYADMAVWPPSLAGGKFPLKDTVFPPMFARGNKRVTL